MRYIILLLILLIRNDMDREFKEVDRLGLYFKNEVGGLADLRQKIISTEYREWSTTVFHSYATVAYLRLAIHYQRKSSNFDV